MFYNLHKSVRNTVYLSQTIFSRVFEYRLTGTTIVIEIPSYLVHVTFNIIREQIYKSIKFKSVNTASMLL